MSSNLKVKVGRNGFWSDWIYDMKELKGLEFDEVIINEEMTREEFEKFEKKYK